MWTAASLNRCHVISQQSRQAQNILKWFENACVEPKTERSRNHRDCARLKEEAGLASPMGGLVRGSAFVTRRPKINFNLATRYFKEAKVLRRMLTASIASGIDGMVSMVSNHCYFLSKVSDKIEVGALRCFPTKLKQSASMPLWK